LTLERVFLLAGSFGWSEFPQGIALLGSGVPPPDIDTNHSDVGGDAHFSMASDFAYYMSNSSAR
jgi:hypothetical protein